MSQTRTEFTNILGNSSNNANGNDESEEDYKVIVPTAMTEKEKWQLNRFFRNK